MDAMHQMLLLVHWHMNYTYCGIMWIVDFMRKNICQLSGLLIFYCFDFHLLTSCLVCVFFYNLDMFVTIRKCCCLRLSIIRPRLYTKFYTLLRL